ncbi:MAG: DNRLRE domain-containing protein [Euryarchaeota archaeon]|nr:DNRLRE domain-containing protein [Euryarchaeota archaeon]
MAYDSLSRTGKGNARASSILVAVVMGALMLVPTGLAWGGKNVAEPAPLSQPVGPATEGVPSDGPGVQTVVIQPNATDGKDSEIVDDGQSYNNYGNQDVLQVGTTVALNAVDFIRFSLPTQPIRLLSATLSLFCDNVNSPPYGVNVSLNMVNSSWTEGTGTFATPSVDDVNWINYTTGTAWATPGGDYNRTVVSYINVSQANTWYHWNITQIVSLWMAGTVPNNGLAINGTPLGTANNWVEFWSSDYIVNTNLTPKLTVIYSAEIKTPLADQTMQEDEATRNIALNGMGNGTIEHVSGPDDISNVQPFWGSACAWMHFMAVYTADQVGAEGTIRRMSLNRTQLSDTGVFNNFRIAFTHTNRTILDATSFATNYYGKLIQVYNVTNLDANSSNLDSWINFDLSDNFTYDSTQNLLVDIIWIGDNGGNLNLDSTNMGSDRIVWESDIQPITGTPRTLMTKFLIDVVDNSAISNGTSNNFWPFAMTSETQMHHQSLYNFTLMNGSGVIDKIMFQSNNAAVQNAAVQQLSIRLAHSTNTSLGTVYEANRVDAWVEVLNRSFYNFTTGGLGAWIPFDVANTFTYNGVQNLLVDIRWFGGSGNDIDLCQNQSAVYTGQMSQNNYDATVGLLGNNRVYNFQVIYADSANLSWSSASSNPALFTTGTNGANGRNLWITPTANANGVGTLTLTLTNSNGFSVTQNVQVTINAVNDAPVLTGVPATIPCVEDIDYVLNMSAYATDIDDVLANLTFLTNSSHATVNHTLITFNYGEGQNGESVLITVRDQNGLTDTAVTVTTVTYVNDQPYFTSVVANLTCDATVLTQYIVTTGDEETPLNVSITTSSPYATVDNHLVWFLYPKGVGAENVNITIWDITTYGVMRSASSTLLVTVIDHPDVTASSPTGSGVSVTTALTATFDVAMDTAVTGGAFKLSLGGANVPGNVTWSADNKTLTFAPSTHLTNGEYNASIGTGAKDANGTAMLQPFRWNFTAALGTFDGDGDTIPDQYEMDHGLNPNADDAQSDLDGDGMPNLYEYQHSLNPQTNDASADADGDGSTNYQEYVAGTDPQDAASKPTKPLLGGDYMWIILIIVIVAIVAVVALVFVMKKKGKPAQAPEQPSGAPPLQEQTPQQEAPPAPQGEQPPQQQQ